MPIYEYECVKCGHQTQALQKFSDPPLSKCEMCKGKMKKLISQSTFHLKGSGWYVTDYASKGSGNQNANKTSDTKASTKESKDSSTRLEKKDSSSKASDKSTQSSKKTAE